MDHATISKLGQKKKQELRCQRFSGSKCCSLIGEKRPGHNSNFGILPLAHLSVSRLNFPDSVWNIVLLLLVLVCSLYYVCLALCITHTSNVHSHGSFKDFFFLICFSDIGVVQGMITGIRGLCNGLGPALYGFVFYLFHVELTDADSSDKGAKLNMANPTDEVSFNWKSCI